MPVSAALSSWPDYKVGETARVDVVAPVSLLVVDRQATDALRLREAQKVPAIFRFTAGAAAEAEANLRGSFGFTREDFMQSLELAYSQRKLTPALCARPRFAQFVAGFRNKNKGFPLSTNLAQLWATGQPDEPFLAEWVVKLRQAMEQPIRTDSLSPEARLGPGVVRLMHLPGTNSPLSLEMVEKQSTGFFKSNLVTLARARKNLVDGFGPEEQVTGKFLASFAKENCFFEAALTRQSRAKQTESIWTALTYEPGQTLICSGEVVTAQAKAALQQLKAKFALDSMQGRLAGEERISAQANETRLRYEAQLAEQKAQERNRWLLAGLLVTVGIGIASLWRVAKIKRQQGSFLPVKAGRQAPWIHTQGSTALLACPACAETIVVDLPSPKALPEKAQPSAQPAPASPEGSVRQGRIPFWLQQVMSRIMRTALWQRAVLLDTQRLAEMEVAALEKRLARMNAPLQERIQVYEKRISELERDLAVQQQQNADMIKAQISVARQALERERQKAPRMG